MHLNIKHHPDRGGWIAPRKFIYQNEGEYVEVAAWTEMEATYKIIRTLMEQESESTLKDVTKKTKEV